MGSSNHYETVGTDITTCFELFSEQIKKYKSN